MTWPRARSRASRSTSTPSTTSSRRRPCPPRSWPRRGSPAAASATRAVSSSATRWSSRPPAGWPPSTPPTRAWSSAASTCAPRSARCRATSAGSGCATSNYDVLLIDWRAPAAAVFYQATQADPQGVVRRRILRSKGVKVLGVEDDLLDAEAETDLPIVGEGALLAQLTRARDRSMHSIVATIQAEQDRAIRAPNKGVVSITGGPGTGKTVVALHRAAFLLYGDRRRYETGGVLVVGPSGVFMRYIERVLPSLGETAVALRSLGEVVDGVRATRRDDPAVAEVKGSLAMAEVLRRTSRQAVPDAPARVPGLLPRRRDPPRAARARRAPAPAADDGSPQPVDDQGGLDADRRDVAPGAQRARRASAPRRTSPPRCAPTTSSSSSPPPGGRCSTPRPCSAGCATPSCWPASARACSTTSRCGCSRSRGATSPLRRRRRPARRAALPARRPADRQHRLGRRRVPRGRGRLAARGLHRLRPGVRRPARLDPADQPGRGRRLRARARRRGPGPHPDAVADGRPARSRRHLDDRRRPGAVVVAGAGRVGGRSRARRSATSRATSSTSRPTTATARRSTTSRPSTPRASVSTPTCPTRSGRPGVAPTELRVDDLESAVRSAARRARRLAGGHGRRRRPGRAPRRGHPLGVVVAGVRRRVRLARLAARRTHRAGHQGPRVRRHRRRGSRRRSRTSRPPAAPPSTSSTPAPPSGWSPSRPPRSDADPPLGRGDPRRVAGRAVAGRLRPAGHRRPRRRVPGRGTDPLPVRRRRDTVLLHLARPNPVWKALDGRPACRTRAGRRLHLRRGRLERQPRHRPGVRRADVVLHGRPAALPRRDRRRPGREGGAARRPARPLRAGRLDAGHADRRPTRATAASCRASVGCGCTSRACGRR